VTPSGDVTMDNAGAFTVTKIRGSSVSATAPADGQVLKYIAGGTNEWTPSNITFSDIKNSLGGSAFNIGTCGANQTVKWSSLTDTFECVDISIAATQITDITATGNALVTAADAA